MRRIQSIDHSKDRSGRTGWLEITAHVLHCELDLTLLESFDLPFGQRHLTVGCARCLADDPAVVDNKRDLGDFADQELGTSVKSGCGPLSSGVYDPGEPRLIQGHI